MKKLKYNGYSIVMQEVPNEVSLAINISGCPHKCEGCHSKYLWEYDGEYLIDDIERKKVNCVITKDLSRFGRNMGWTHVYLSDLLPELKVRFISINDISLTFSR